MLGTLVGYSVRRSLQLLKSIETLAVASFYAFRFALAVAFSLASQLTHWQRTCL